MKFRKTILAAMVFVGVLVGIFFWLRPVPPPPVVLPNRNGHDDFVRAGQLCMSSTNSYLKMTEEELRDYVTKTLPALTLVEAGLKKECQVPIEYSTHFLNQHLPQLL